MPEYNPTGSSSVTVCLGIMPRYTIPRTAHCEGGAMAKLRGRSGHR